MTLLLKYLLFRDGRLIILDSTDRELYAINTDINWEEMMGKKIYCTIEGNRIVDVENLDVI